MMIAAGVCLLLLAGLLRTRYGRLRLALWLLICGNVLIDAANRLIDGQSA